ncbi:type IV pilus modification PilV family protein [Desulfosporosinus meridiei]|uniref:Prepilin-type N-terminal cleavage/methylation domain-containing protein n=1 Tax=Desulfosporosinus meridiei (strain ATCC BAA-275 / DSM 13257 / KCTC 12902 / NCIMB 13706 / S10) TaxID=768704 RepID=J7IV69_DESMD|nr:prepilin-type N-terminal cleavage/methylation domain-containing protein [Desulfosporosinus meridiei]AFQ43008.1 prepilin-type N-terminal cleavage/methylation domain-containing protein [Desulfosporosinus meridiei DSM 13257]
MKAKYDKGFTLVEVMIALAIVAIVSTPLLRMFVTTSYANHEAQVMDSANTIVVQKAEIFKANPEGYRSEHGDESYDFYKEDGTFIGEYPDLSDIPSGAAMMIKSTMSGPQNNGSNVPEVGYYPDFALTINLSKYASDVDLLKLTVSDCYVISVDPLAGLILVDTMKFTDTVIPIRVDFHGDKKTINVENYSDKEAEFYIFNAEDNSDVTIHVVKGASSTAFVNNPETIPSKSYNLTLTVNRLKEGIWAEMLNYSALANDYSAK